MHPSFEIFWTIKKFTIYFSHHNFRNNSLLIKQIKIRTYFPPCTPCISLHFKLTAKDNRTKYDDIIIALLEKPHLHCIFRLSFLSKIYFRLFIGVRFMWIRKDEKKENNEKNNHACTQIISYIVLHTAECPLDLSLYLSLLYNHTHICTRSIALHNSNNNILWWSHRSFVWLKFN